MVYGCRGFGLGASTFTCGGASDAADGTAVDPAGTVASLALRLDSGVFFSGGDAGEVELGNATQAPELEPHSWAMASTIGCISTRLAPLFSFEPKQRPELSTCSTTSAWFLGFLASMIAQQELGPAHL